ncbi:putative nucleotide pyrophosphatase (putative) [Agrilactobacillus composti DSM 18527 = JCM 14202]|uniref:Putative nucleotide pyrophosphatase (Putative) n=1 Tax=Agrilactobacillus composti DSM 18527 = JCM 14202 TaxID=1423734 RepID=A0A0R1Y3Y9_9LACO|nr:ectonucleotide pyrophosphatase/phosphodiesterase [Agrilactobacillus composti]KRM36517.1 putative nucleotide pyrophosphatase (putative) [Agrilactobacillus composti DSM 18527 = JCM 14202]
MSKKLVIISLDALGSDDLSTAHLKLLPNLRHLIQTGTHIQEIDPILPTLTYPSHTTIITGNYPNKHGIVNNVKIQSNRQSPDWFWYRKAVKSQPLYDIAKAHHLTTAAFLWPVTARSSIDYNIAEIFSNRIWNNQVMVSLWASSPLFVARLNAKYGKLRRGIRQPYLDAFISACAVDTLKRKKPDLTLIHLVDMDAHRHRYGVRSDQAYQALQRLDQHVGAIVQATKDAHTYHDTTFAILGDHYQIDVDHMIRLNTLFKEQGWLHLTNKQTIAKDWQVFANSCDGTTYIYTRPDFKDSAQLNDLLATLPAVARIYPPEELIQDGADPAAAFMCEAKRGYYFINDATGPVVEAVNPDEIGQPDRYRGVHGYSPFQKDYKTTLLFNGPEIKRNHKIANARLIDEAPTFAKILGLSMPQDIDGQTLTDIFK